MILGWWKKVSNAYAVKKPRPKSEPGRLTRRTRRGEVSPCDVEAPRQRVYMNSWPRWMADFKATMARRR